VNGALNPGGEVLLQLWGFNKSHVIKLIVSVDEP